MQGLDHQPYDMPSCFSRTIILGGGAFTMLRETRWLGKARTAMHLSSEYSWALGKELKLSCHGKESASFTMDPFFGKT